MYKLIFTLFTVSCCIRGKCQDPNFSQFFASPVTLNPAYTGKMDGNFRVNGMYRNQWPTINRAFITYAASFDFKLQKNKTENSDAWGLGVSAMSDQSAGGLLKSNYLSLTTAYHKSLDAAGFHYLGIGFQGTYASRQIDGNKLNLGDELDRDGGWTIPSGDPLAGRQMNTHFFDANIGLLYTGSTNGTNNYYIGASLYHITRPSEQFFDDVAHALKQRLTIHAGGYMELGSSSLLHFSGLHSRQAGATNTVAGGAVSWTAIDNEITSTNIYLGCWYRLKDALIPFVGIEYNNFQVGLTYDVNISALKQASQKQGGLELSLIYTQRAGRNKDFLPCPKF